MFGKSKTKIQREEDKIWRTTAAKIRGLCADIRHLGADGNPVVVFTHFEETLRLLQDALLDANFSAEKLSSRMTFMRKIANPGVYLMPVDRLLPSDTLTLAQPFERTICALIAEHHPLPDDDKVVRDFLESLCVPCLIRFYDALDSPLFKVFGGDRLAAMLDRLGLSPDEAISHVLVTNAIENVQRKIERTTKSRVPARSVTEWFQLNHPAENQ